MTHGRPKFCLMLGLGSLAALFALSIADTGAAAEDDHPVVVLDTTLGAITIELDRTKAPVTVDNFLKYVDDGFYNSTIFHRVIPKFMIQGGGMNDAMQEKQTRAPIRNESGNGLSNVRGSIAMARTNNPDSATAQFFINHVDNANLDTFGGGYAVFGKVVDGMKTVDEIAAVPTETKGVHENVPQKPVYIKSAKRKPKS